MRIERGRWVGLAILVLALLLAPLLRGADYLDRAPFVWVGIGLLGATGLVALIGYRGSHNPTQLYVGVGAGAVATQALVTAFIALLFFHADGSSRFAGAGLYGWFASNTVLAVCLLLAAPWKDRRGQPPPRAVRTMAAGFGVVVVANLVGAAWPPSDDVFASFGFRTAVATIAAASFIAGVRLLLNVRGARTTFGWLAAGAFAGALVLATTAAFLTLSLDVRTVTATRMLMALCEGAFLLAGTLNAIQLERTRLRRTSDRAAEVMEGRAEIASIVAHDVRGPAGTIRSASSSSE